MRLWESWGSEQLGKALGNLTDTKGLQVTRFHMCARVPSLAITVENLISNGTN